MKKILVPTDFSAYADNALTFAAELARKTQAKIILLHAFDVPYSSGYTSYNEFGREMEEAKHESDRRLQEQIHQHHLTKHSHAVVSVHAYASDAILKTALVERPNLIIMGSKGVHNLPERVFGGNTSVIVEKATCPVLVVPANITFSGMHDVVMATSCTEHDIKLLEKLAHILKPLGSHVHLVQVAEGERDAALHIMHGFAEAVAGRTGMKVQHTVLPKGNVEECLAMFIHERHADMLMVSPGQHGYLGKLFGRSLTRKMALHTETPLLALH